MLIIIIITMASHIHVIRISIQYILNVDSQANPFYFVLYLI